MELPILLCHMSLLESEDDIIKLIEEYLSDVSHNINDNIGYLGLPFNKTILHTAIHVNKPKVVKYIVDQGADVNSSGMSYQGGRDIHKKFSEDMLSFEKWTPIHEAVCAGNIEILKYLMDESGKFNAKELGEFNNLSLAQLAVYKDKYKVLDYFKAEHPEYLTEQSLYGTLLEFALSKHSQSSVDYLINTIGIDHKAPMSNGRTAIHAAMNNKNLAVLKYCIEGLGYDVNGHYAGYTPLALAAVNCNLEASRYLLSRGASPTLESENGYSPIHFAIRHENYEIVRLYLDEYKVDINHIYSKCDSLLDYAYKYSTEDMQEFLKERGAFACTKLELSSDGTINRGAMLSEGNKVTISEKEMLMYNFTALLEKNEPKDVRDIIKIIEDPEFSEIKASQCVKVKSLIENAIGMRIIGQKSIKNLSELLFAKVMPDDLLSMRKILNYAYDTIEQVGYKHFGILASKLLESDLDTSSLDSEQRLNLFIGRDSLKAEFERYIVRKLPLIIWQEIKYLLSGNEYDCSSKDTKYYMSLIKALPDEVFIEDGLLEKKAAFVERFTSIEPLRIAMNTASLEMKEIISDLSRVQQQIKQQKSKNTKIKPKAIPDDVTAGISKICEQIVDIVKSGALFKYSEFLACAKKLEALGVKFDNHGLWGHEKDAAMDIADAGVRVVTNCFELTTSNLLLFANFHNSKKTDSDFYKSVISLMNVVKPQNNFVSKLESAICYLKYNKLLSKEEQTNIYLALKRLPGNLLESYIQASGDEVLNALCKRMSELCDRATWDTSKTRGTSVFWNEAEDEIDADDLANLSEVDNVDEDSYEEGTGAGVGTGGGGGASGDYRTLSSSENELLIDILTKPFKALAKVTLEGLTRLLDKLGVKVEETADGNKYIFKGKIIFDHDSHVREKLVHVKTIARIKKALINEGIALKYGIFVDDSETSDDDFDQGDNNVASIAGETKSAEDYE